MADAALPLIAEFSSARPFAWVDGRSVSRTEALAAVEVLAARLEPGRNYVNCCANRYRFTIAFAAVCRAGSTNLLPPALAPGALADLEAEYSCAARIDDATLTDDRLPEPAVAGLPLIPARHPAAVVFTSGSTGVPQPHVKYWGDLVAIASLYQQRFFGDGDPEHVVATVPPGHMYGLETTVLPALCCGLPVAAERPSTPWAIRDALAALPSPTLLITAPVHLRALAESGLERPNLGRVLSATAPLPVELAAELEARWQISVHEIFGSTETGSIASRRTTQDDWTLYDDVTLSEGDGGYWYVTGPQLPEPMVLADAIAPIGDNQFRFLGRASDILKVGGKRVSRTALENELMQIDGVNDAAVLEPCADSPGGRPRALVVSPCKSAQNIASELVERVDPVFVPRPLLCVGRLPRDAVGKISRDAMLDLFEHGATGRPATDER